jgi:hypothetical protein
VCGPVLRFFGAPAVPLRDLPPLPVYVKYLRKKERKKERKKGRKKKEITLRSYA